MTEQETKSSGEKPASAPEDQLMDHEYDGIREYDNPLPRWWVWIFWGSFFFAIAYFVHYHVSHRGQSIAEAYDQDVQAAASQGGPQGPNVTEDSLAATLASADHVKAGEAIFGLRCMPCHGDRGQGVVGPNLTDDSWIHGHGKLLDIYETVSEGVAAKGMPEWRKQLSPQEIIDVVAFVGTLRGKKVAGKAPEGHEVKGY